MSTGTSEQRRPATGFRGLTVFSVVTALAVIAVLGYAVVRHLTSPQLPVLPLSWCRTGASTSLPPLLGRALFTQWHLDAIALAVLAVPTVLYVGGVTALRRRDPESSWPVSRTVSFLAGIGVCVLATNSSIAVYDMALFTAHMIGHLMLVMLAPALLAYGRPLTLLVETSQGRRRERISRLLTGPVVSLMTAPPIALACYTAVIVGSHLTGLMDKIMVSPWIGQVEHLVYVVIGMQFFTVVLGNEPIRWQLGTPARWLLVAVSMAVDTFTGVILLMSARPITMTSVPGLAVNTLSDTRTGGAIMWVGGDGLMAAVMVLMALEWLGRPELRQRDRGGWLEQARQGVFSEHTGASYTPPGQDPDRDFDEDELRLRDYNRWLASIAEPGASRQAPGAGTNEQRDAV
jgi:cytochrome c oxidase assembly factor CtaG